MVNFDTILVFGEGPVKPLIFVEEATETQKAEWEAYKKDSTRYREPDFWIIEKSEHLLQLAQISKREDISEAEKLRLKEEKRIEWQKDGWYALKAMGRQNALAAGYSLYKGITKRVIFTGGKTMSPQTKSRLLRRFAPRNDEERVQDYIADWPSEAVLMKQIIISTYGSLYEKKYKKPIDEVIDLEECATNTLENFSYSINKFPILLSKTQRIGFLSANHHLKRIKVLADLFSVQSNNCLSCQELLQEANIRHCEGISPDAKEQYEREERWMKGLQDPSYIEYWLGYVGEVEDPTVVSGAFKRLFEPEWIDKAQTLFNTLGIPLDEYREVDLQTLALQNPEKYCYLLQNLKKLKQPEYRRIPF